MSRAGHVLLVGFMGAGKSTVGRVLADTISNPFVDLDARIEAVAQRPIPDIFAESGEDAFRDLESSALEALLEEPASVVACGGGVVLRESNRRLLAELGTCVYLQVDAQEALERIGDLTARPLLHGLDPAAVERLVSERERFYLEVADIVIDTRGRSPKACAKEIVQRLGAVR